MMIQARGPKWHKRDKEAKRIPEGLRGVDQEAIWGYSGGDSWVYGHGSFSMSSHRVPVLGCFYWMANSGHEAKELWLKAGRYRGVLDCVVMDSKADDVALFEEFRRQRQMTLVTRCRRRMDKTARRQAMIQCLQRPYYQKLLRERSYKVEPMQALVREIFSLDRCWMRGNASNRWLFAAMGLAIQMHQLEAYRAHRSTWKIKQRVLGDP